MGRTEGSVGQLNNIHVLSVPEEYCDKESALDYDADFIARYIRRCLDEGLTMPRSEKELAARMTSQAVPGDFMVVTWNTKHLGIYARKLQELGVPCQAGGGGGLGEVTELRLWVQVIQALVEPENPVALVTVLRGELFGFSDAELYAFRRSGGAFSFRSRLPEWESESAGRFAAAWARLQQYASWLTTLPVVAAVERIAGDLGLPQRALLAAGGNVRAGSFAQAFQLLRQAHADMHSLVDVAVFLKDLLERQGKQDGIAARPQTASAVRLLNLHKVKGLEAPVVFLAAPFGKWQPPVDLHIDRAKDRVQGYLAIYEDSESRHPKLLACPAGWDDYVEEERRFIRAEQTRLLYVAATRVGCHLVVTRKEKDNGKTNYWDFFSSFLDGRDSLPDPGRPRPLRQKTVKITGEDVRNAAAERADRRQASATPTYAAAAAKEIALTPAGLHRSAGAGEHGTEWGTVIHFLLQQAMLTPEGDLRPAAIAALEEQGLSTERVDEALATVRAVKASAVWRRACASSRILVEVPFARLLDTGEAGTTLPTVLRGVIDLAFEEPGGWVIVDYKTDAVAPEHLTSLVDHYRPQVDSYARNWERFVGQPVKERGLYFVRTDTYQPV